MSAEADWKRHQRETGAQRLQSLLTNGCKKPDGSGRPSGLPPSWGGGLAGQPCAHHPLPGALSRQTTLPCRGCTQPLLPPQPHPLQARASPPTHCPGVGVALVPAPVLARVWGILAWLPLLPHVIAQATQAWQTDKEISQCRQNLRQGLDGLTSLRSSNTRDGCQAVAGSLALCWALGGWGFREGRCGSACTQWVLSAACPPSRGWSHSSLLNSRTSV